jgi:YbbR domain-containing protein
MNRLGLKISCLVASVLIWVQVAATTDVEQAANLPVRVVGLAEGLTYAGSAVPATVEVRLRGSKLRLLTNRFFRRYVGEVRLNLDGFTAGPEVSYQLATRDVVSDLEVVRLQQDERVRLRIDTVATRRLPVAVMLAGELPRGTAFLVAPRAEPDSAAVTGPARFVPESGAVATEPLALERLQLGREDEERNLRLVAPHEHVMVAPAQVRIRCTVAPLEERTLANVPVIPLVDAGQPDVGVSPPAADVLVRGVADSVRALTEARLAVTVAVGDLPEGQYLLPGQVDCPPWLTLLGVVPDQFRVIVGDPPLSQPTGREAPARKPPRGGADG